MPAISLNPGCFRLSALVACLLTLAVSAHGQSSQSTALQALAQKDYAAALTALTPELPKIVQAPGKRLDTLVAVAIALERTQGWTGERWTPVMAALGPSQEALSDLEGIRLLLGGDTTGLSRLVGVERLDASVTARASRLCKAHDFPLAAEIFTIVGAGMQGERVLAWGRLPLDKRGPVDAYFTRVYGTGGVNCKLLVESALWLYMYPPKGAGETAAAFDFALKFGGPVGVNSLENAQQLWQAGRRDQARAMARHYARDHATDVPALRQALAFLWGRTGDPAAGRALCEELLPALPDPYARLLRLDYLLLLARTKDTTRLQELAGGADPLLAGDVRLIEQALPAATAAYARVVKDGKESLPRRLAAWSGLLDADPAAALPPSGPLLEEVGKLAPEMRTPLLAWYGWGLWTAVWRAIPSGGPSHEWLPFERAYGPTFADAPGWEKAVLARLTRLRELDPALPARPRTDRSTSLRFAYVLLYALNKQPDKAVEMLACKIDYQLPPPPAGWTNFDGSPARDATQPRTISTPSGRQPDDLARYLVETLAVYPNAEELLPPVSACLLPEITTKLKAATVDAAVTAPLRTLAAMVKCTSALIAREKTPAPLTLFDPIEQTARDVLTSDPVAKGAPTLLQEGLLPALRLARDPKLRERLETLTLTLLARHRAAAGAPAASVAAAMLIKALEKEQREELGQFLGRVREGYSKP
jgi:hypothetical protein